MNPDGFSFLLPEIRRKHLQWDLGASPHFILQIYLFHTTVVFCLFYRYISFVLQMKYEIK